MTQLSRGCDIRHQSAGTRLEFAALKIDGSISHVMAYTQVTPLTNNNYVSDVRPSIPTNTITYYRWWTDVDEGMKTIQKFVITDIIAQNAASPSENHVFPRLLILPVL